MLCKLVNVAAQNIDSPLLPSLASHFKRKKSYLLIFTRIRTFAVSKNVNTDKEGVFSLMTRWACVIVQVATSIAYLVTIVSSTDHRENTSPIIAKFGQILMFSDTFEQQISAE